MTDLNLRWYSIVVDSHDVRALSQWWADVLGWQRIYDTEDECVIVPKDASPDPLTAQTWKTVGPGLVFVPVPESKTVKNRLHIDLAPHLDDDRDAQIARLLELGATTVDVGQSGNESWTVLADPEGNEFCVLSARNR